MKLSNFEWRISYHKFYLQNNTFLQIEFNYRRFVLEHRAAEQLPD